MRDWGGRESPTEAPWADIRSASPVLLRPRQKISLAGKPFGALHIDGGLRTVELYPQSRAADLEESLPG